MLDGTIEQIDLRIQARQREKHQGSSLCQPTIRPRVDANNLISPGKQVSEPELMQLGRASLVQENESNIENTTAFTVGGHFKCTKAKVHQ